MAKRSTVAKATRVVGYVRVSTEGQVKEGFSLEAQRIRIAAYATAMGLELVAVVEDAGRSAKSLERPGLQEALSMLGITADGLLVAKLDRLTRSVRDLGELVDRYFGTYQLLSVADSIDTRTSGGRLVLNVLASVSQWEREAIGERTREGMAVAKASGVRFGPAPLEGPAVSRIRELRAEGATLTAIAAAMTTEGYATHRGGRWAPETVRKVLARGA